MSTNVPTDKNEIGERLVSKPARPIFGIFQGGGAKGVAHVGAVAAAEEENFFFAGVAGASAGAMVAALLAAGYKAKDLMNPRDPRDNIVSRSNLSPVDLFGEREWRKFRRVQESLSWLSTAWAVSGVVPLLFASPRRVISIWKIYQQRGHFHTSAIADFINCRVRERLKEIFKEAGRSPEEVPDKVRFRDLDYVTFPRKILPLKIVATNVSTQRPQLFDLTRTPDEYLGEVVAASIAIPLVFQPVALNAAPEHVFVDGGLVSNLPFWVFAEEKLAYERGNPLEPRVPIVAFTLEEPTDASDIISHSHKFVPYLLATARTAVFGSQSIGQSLVEDLLVIKLQPALSVLEFDAGWKKICDAYLQGYRATRRRLRIELDLKPYRINTELKRIVNGTRGRINKIRKRNRIPDIKHLRANIIEPFGQNSFRITHSYNMDNDADDLLRLDRRGFAAPVAFLTKNIRYFNLVPNPAPQDFMTKYERALVRTSLKSVFCIPIFLDVAVWEKQPDDRPEPIGVLCIDSDEDMGEDSKDQDLLVWLANQAARVGKPLRRDERSWVIRKAV